MVSCYGYVISRRWSSHFWVKVHVFSNFFSTVKEILGLRSCKALIYVLFFTSSTKKSPFLAVLTWFLILGKIQDGDHCWWRHRPPAAPPPIKCTSSCKEDQRPSTEEKIVLKYCNKPKTLGGMVSSTTPLVPRWGYVYVRGLNSGYRLDWSIVSMVLVVSQFSRDVIGYEDSWSHWCVSILL